MTGNGSESFAIYIPNPFGGSVIELASVFINPLQIESRNLASSDYTYNNNTNEDLRIPVTTTVNTYATTGYTNITVVINQRGNDGNIKYTNRFSGTNQVFSKWGMTVGDYFEVYVTYTNPSNIASTTESYYSIPYETQGDYFNNYTHANYNTVPQVTWGQVTWGVPTAVVPSSSTPSQDFADNIYVVKLNADETTPNGPQSPLSMSVTVNAPTQTPTASGQLLQWIVAIWVRDSNGNGVAYSYSLNGGTIVNVSAGYHLSDSTTYTVTASISCNGGTTVTKTGGSYQIELYGLQPGYIFGYSSNYIYKYPNGSWGYSLAASTQHDFTNTQSIRKPFPLSLFGWSQSNLPGARSDYSSTPNNTFTPWQLNINGADPSYSSVGWIGEDADQGYSEIFLMDFGDGTSGNFITQAPNNLQGIIDNNYGAPSAEPGLVQRSIMVKPVVGDYTYATTIFTNWLRYFQIADLEVSFSYPVQRYGHTVTKTTNPELNSSGYTEIAYNSVNVTIDPSTMPGTTMYLYYNDSMDPMLGNSLSTNTIADGFDTNPGSSTYSSGSYSLTDNTNTITNRYFRSYAYLWSPTPHYAKFSVVFQCADPSISIGGNSLVLGAPGTGQVQSGQSGKWWDGTSVSVTMTNGVTSGAALEYSTNGGSTWNTYSSALSITTPTTIYFKATKSNYNDSNVYSFTINFQADSPTINVNGGATADGATETESYGSITTVAITGSSSSYTLQYSLDGGTTWNNYSSAFTVSDSTHVEARASESGYAISPTVTNTIVFATEPPSISPNGGTFDVAQTVSIACGQSGAAIQYSLDGGNWTPYTSAFTLDKSAFVYAKAQTSQRNMSAVTQSTYFTFYCDGPTIIADGVSEYNGAKINRAYGQTTTITLNEPRTQGTTLYYSLNNGVSWTLYTGAFTVSDSCTIYAQAQKTGYNTSSNSELIIIFATETPTISPNGSTASPSPVIVTLADAQSTASNPAVINYSLDGGNTWTVYSTPLTIDSNSTLETHAVTAGRNWSNYASANFNFKCATPNCSPLGGTYDQSLQTVTLTEPTTVGTTIHYSLDGGSTWNVYSTPVLIGTSETIQYYASKSGYDNSDTASQKFIYTNEPRIYLSAPQSGYVGNGWQRYFNAAITLEFEEALQPTPYTTGVIYYTEDGTTPDPASTPTFFYKTTADASTNPTLQISKSCKVTILETRTGWLNNTDSTQVNILKPPVSSVVDGTYNKTFTVTLSDEDPTGLICFTIDGTTPSVSLVSIDPTTWASLVAGGSYNGSPVIQSGTYTNLDGVGYEYLRLQNNNVITGIANDPNNLYYLLGPTTGYFGSNQTIIIDHTLVMNYVSVHYDLGFPSALANTLVVSGMSTSNYTMAFLPPTATVVNDDASPTVTRIGAWLRIDSIEPFEKVWFDVEHDGIYNDDYCYYLCPDNITPLGYTAFLPILSTKMRLHITRTGWTTSPVYDVSSLYSIAPVSLNSGNEVTLLNQPNSVFIDQASEIITMADQPIPQYTVNVPTGYNIYWNAVRNSPRATAPLYINKNGLGRAYITTDGSTPNPATPNTTTLGNTQYTADYNAADPVKTDVNTFTDFQIITVFNVMWSLTNSSVVNYDGSGAQSPLSRSKFSSDVKEFTIYVKVGTPTYSFVNSYEMSEMTNVQVSDGSLTIQRMIEILQSLTGMSSFSITTTQQRDKLRIASLPVLLTNYPTLDDISGFSSIDYPTVANVLVPNSKVLGFSLTVDGIVQTFESTIDSLTSNTYSQDITEHTLIIARGEYDDCIPSDYVVLIFASKLPSPIFNYTDGYYTRLTKEVVISQGNNLVSLAPSGVPVLRYNRVDKFGDENMQQSDVTPPTETSTIWNPVSTPFYPIVSTAIEVIAYLPYNFPSDPSTLLLNIVELVPPQWEILDSSNNVLYDSSNPAETVFISDDVYTLRVYPFMDGEYTYVRCPSPYDNSDFIFVKLVNSTATSVDPSNGKNYIDIPLKNNFYPSIEAIVGSTNYPMSSITFTMWTQTDIIGVSPSVTQTISFESKPNIISLVNQTNDIANTSVEPWTVNSLNGTFVTLNNPFPPLSDAPIDYLDNFKMIYTLDGSDPLTSPTAQTIIPDGSNISEPIAISESLTITTVILYPLRLLSTSSQSIELIIRDPYFDFPSGSIFEHEQKISILCLTTGVKLYYTTDGSDPLPSNQFRRLYKDSIEFEDFGTFTIKAIAEKQGWTSSNIISATYNVENTKYISDDGKLDGGSGYVRNVDR